MKKLTIRMVSGKEHTIIDEPEMMKYYIDDLTCDTQKTININNSTIFIDKIEEYRIELDYESMS